jgi:hypothetical protein
MVYQSLDVAIKQIAKKAQQVCHGEKIGDSGQHAG